MNSIILATEASMYFANLIALQLPGSEIVNTVTKYFGNTPEGERYYRIGLDDRFALLNKDVILVGSTHTDRDIEELYRVGCAASAYGARRLIFVIPFFGYSTMERAVLSNEVVTAKTIARQLSMIPQAALGNYFLMMDLHVSGLVHYFEGDCKRFELYAEPLLTPAIKPYISGSFVVGTADLGRPQWARTYAQKLATRLVLIDKGREGERSEVLNVVGDVKGREVVIQDDMTRSFDSLDHAATAYLEHGATGIMAILSHGAFNDAAVIQRIQDSEIKKLIVTNTHPMTQSAAVECCRKIEVVDVSGIFAGIIQKILD
jgi:ribose-phosphate pyrophosphokinase